MLEGDRMAVRRFAAERRAKRGEAKPELHLPGLDAPVREDVHGQVPAEAEVPAGLDEG